MGWRISLHRPSPSASSKPDKNEPPNEFICPIIGLLMFDPVVVSSGQSFERATVQVCRELGFSPVLPDGSTPNFTNVISNIALKTTILGWCKSSGANRPPPPDYTSVENTVRTIMESSGKARHSDSRIRDSEVELLNGMADRPEILFSHADTEINHRKNHFYSSSSEESVIANGPATSLLPFATKPLCYSSASSPSTSADIAYEESLNHDSNSEDEEFVVKLNSTEVFEQEKGVISLRKITRTKEETRVSLCTPRLLLALRSLLISRYSTVQTNAVASLVNLSLEKLNKVKIVRSGMVPPLIDLLKGGFPESQEHAAGALFSLSLEDDNKTAIGVLGALQPLLHALRSESDRTRQDSALALYHLSLVQSNRVKLVKFGAITTFLDLVRNGDLAGRALLVLCNLAACIEGRSVMLDAGAVECLVGLLRDRREPESESIRENCVAALFSLSHGNLRFKGLLRDAKAGEVLREVEQRGSDRAREKAKKMLMMMRGGRDEEEDEVEDLERVSEAGGVRRNRYHHFGRNVPGPNSTEF